MPNRSKKIVIWGTVLTSVSFLIGLLHSSLPAILHCFLMIGMMIPFIVLGTGVALAFAVYTVIVCGLIFLAANPLGILVCLGALFLIRYRIAKAKA